MDKIPSKVSDEELNDWIRSVGFKPPTKWIHFKISNINTYVGDKFYVISFDPTIAKDVDSLVEASTHAEEVIIKYLKSEAFVEDEYIYMALQCFNVSDNPHGPELPPEKL